MYTSDRAIALCVLRRCTGVSAVLCLRAQIERLQAHGQQVASEHHHTLQQNEALRQQLDAVQRQRVEQGDELQAVLAEAQLALKHLRAEKVRTACDRRRRSGRRGSATARIA